MKITTISQYLHSIIDKVKNLFIRSNPDWYSTMLHERSKKLNR